MRLQRWIIGRREARDRNGPLFREMPAEWWTRDDCPTCQERRDSDGRLPIGFCSPTGCLMAQVRDGRIAPTRPS